MSSTIIPTLRYRNARAMIAWLGEVIGFEPHLVVDDSQGGVAHAQLTLGAGMVMLGDARDDEFGRLQKPPLDFGATTQSPYVIVADVDAVAEKARRAGAEIVTEPQDQEYGGRLCSFRDPEGHLWNVGSYDPWAEG